MGLARCRRDLLDKRDITGIRLDNLHIDSSLSNGLSVIGKNEQGNIGVLSAATLQNVTISRYGIGTTGKHGLFISAGAHGSLDIKGSNIPETYNDSPDFTLRIGADSGHNQGQADQVRQDSSPR